MQTAKAAAWEDLPRKLRLRLTLVWVKPGELERHHPRPRPVVSREQILLYLAAEISLTPLPPRLSPAHPPLNHYPLTAQRSRVIRG
jgi:hypothetical protein